MKSRTIVLPILLASILLVGAAPEITDSKPKPLSFIKVGETYTFVYPPSGAPIDAPLRYKVLAISEDGWLQVIKEGKEDRIGTKGNNGSWWLNSSQILMLQ